MKGRFKKSLSLILSAVLALGMITAGTFTAKAADNEWKLFYAGEFWAGSASDIHLYTDSGDYSEDIISAKSSNKSVAKFSKGIDVDTYIYSLECKKAGKTKLTIKFRDGNGEERTFTKTIKVKKYPKEFKSLKINGKTINTNKKKFDYFGKTSKTKVSVKAKLKKGWKISKIDARLYDKNWEESKIKVTKKMLSKGSSIKFPKSAQAVEMFIYMKKGNTEIDYYINLARP